MRAMKLTLFCHMKNSNSIAVIQKDWKKKETHNDTAIWNNLKSSPNSKVGINLRGSAKYKPEHTKQIINITMKSSITAGYTKKPTGHHGNIDCNSYSLNYVESNSQLAKCSMWVSTTEQENMYNCHCKGRVNKYSHTRIKDIILQ